MRWKTLAAACGLALLAAPTAFGHHGLRQDVANVLGPLYWGLYLMLPVPFLVIGTIAFRLVRAGRRQAAAQAPDPPPD